MKRVLQVSNILSWFNMIVASFIVIAMLMLLATGTETLMVLTVAMLIGSVALHSYAAMQLRKSILQPQHPLDRNTPVGIKFIGYLVLLLGFLMITNSLNVIQNAKQILSTMKMPEEAKHIDMEGIFKKVAIFTFIFGISMLLNVLMNLRLLRAYQTIAKDSEN